MNATQLPAPSVPVSRLSSPGDVVSMIPYVLGFVPTDSVVLVALEGPRSRFGPVVRIDLPVERRSIPAHVDQLTAFTARQGVDAVLVVAYAAEARSADRTVRSLLAGLRAQGVRVHEALRADGSRWFSYTCRKNCCPTIGTPYDPETSRPAVEAVVAGLTRVDSRDRLREQFEPALGGLRDQVAAACRRLASTQPDLAVATGAELKGLLDAAVEPGADVATRIATLLLAVRDERACTAAMTMMTRPDARLHFEAWREVMRLAPDDQLAAPGSLCAFAAWLDGHGVLAWHALDRIGAVGVKPPLAVLVEGLLERVVPPWVWDEVIGTPAQAGG